MTIQTAPTAPQSSAADTLASEAITSMRPALEQLAAAADAVMGALESPPEKGSAENGVPAGLGRLAVEERIRYLGGLVTLRAPGSEAARQKARRDLLASVDKGEQALTSWLQDERAAAQRDAIGEARPIEETTRALALSALPAGALMADGRRALNAGDADLAAVYVQAGRLAGLGQVIADLATQVDAALDESRPARIAAKQRVLAAQRQYVDARARLTRIVRAANALAAVSPTLKKHPGMAPGEPIWSDAREQLAVLLPAP